jgi:hypothetical protein
MPRIVFFILACVLPAAAYADETLYTREIPFSNLPAMETNFDRITLQAYGSFALIPEAEATGLYQDTLSGRLGILRQKLSFNLTPITVSSEFDEIWTLPADFCELGASLLVGTGWYLNGWGNGIGLQSNFYDPSISSNVYAHNAFNEDYIRFGASAAFQADLAWFIPGPWSHLQFRSFQEIYYRYFLGSQNDNNTWMWDNIPDNMKNLRYHGSYYLGYRMPLFLSRFGFLYSQDIDVAHYNESTVASGGWGSDVIMQEAGFLFTFAFDHENRQTLDLTVIWGNDINYKDNEGTTLELWYRHVYSSTDYDYWHIHRIAFTWNYIF